MKNIHKRMFLFLIGCIGTRSLLVYIAKTTDVKYLPYLGYVGLLPAIGFMYIFITGVRTTGVEVFGEKIWWNNLRPVHAMLYIIFAYKAINKNADAWKILLLDVTIGLVSFLSYHYSAGNFQKLI